MYITRFSGFRVSKKESLGTDTEPKFIELKNKVKSKKEEISLSIEEVNYGARYCLSVAQQMRYDKPHNICTGFDILLDKAEAYSKISLDSENVDEAYEYFKSSENFLYKAVELSDDCNYKKYDTVYPIIN